MTMMNKRSHSSAIGFLDLLFNCLIVFVFMFVVAFAQIEPEKKKAEIKTKAEFIITMTWSELDSNDVDVWIQDPAGNLISFQSKSAGLTHIDRDDRGQAGDVFMTSDGRKVAYDYNQEIVTIRGIIPGEWIVNIHLYKQNQPKPSEVKIRMDQLNPKVTTPFNETIILDKHWQEKTVLRFTLNDKGEILKTSDIPVSLIGQDANMSSRTAGELNRDNTPAPSRTVTPRPNIPAPDSRREQP